MTTSAETKARLEEIIRDKESPFDAVIIGGGPAGLTAGLYCGRSGMKTLVIERALLGGQVSLCSHIENYPGFPSGISGTELAARFEDQAKRFGVEIVWGDVSSIDLGGKLKHVVVDDRKYAGRTLILCTGTEPKKIGIPGEKELRGRGVSYCATCDGAFYRDKEIAVIGGGNSAVQEALFLTRFGKTVSVVHRRDKLRAEKVLGDRAMEDPKVRFYWDSVVDRINGSAKVESIEVRNVKTGEKSTVPMDGVFIYIGESPNTALFKDTLNTDEDGSVIVDDRMRTSVEGVFAAGDVCKKNLRQIATAISDGAIAADSARKYLENML